MSVNFLPLKRISIYLNSGISRPFFSEECGIPVLRSNNVKNGAVNIDGLKFWHKVDPRGANLENVKPQYGDLLINFVNGSSKELGKAGVYRGIPKNCIVSTNFFILRLDKQQALVEYVSYFFQSYLYKKWLYTIAGFSGQGSFNKTEFEKLKIPIFPLPEQKAIADLLSTWDKAIEKTERLIQAKEKQLRQMSRWLIFGYKRLSNQRNEMVDGRFFKYPADWGLVKIGEVAKEVSIRNGESEETVLSCSKYDGFVNSLDYFGKQVFSSDTSNYKVVKKGQFGYPSNHVEEGSIGLLEHCEKGIVSPIYVVFEASKEKVHSPYLYRLLKTDIYRHIFQISTSSSVDRRGSLRWSDFSKIKILLPSLKEQQKISETLSSIQYEIDLLIQLSEKYNTQKRGLMQKMLTGEWRIQPEIVKQHEEL